MSHKAFKRVLTLQLVVIVACVLILPSVLVMDHGNAHVYSYEDGGIHWFIRPLGDNEYNREVTICWGCEHDGQYAQFIGIWPGFYFAVISGKGVPSGIYVALVAAWFISFMLQGLGGDFKGHAVVFGILNAFWTGCAWYERAPKAIIRPFVLVLAYVFLAVNCSLYDGVLDRRRR